VASMHARKKLSMPHFGPALSALTIHGASTIARFVGKNHAINPIRVVAQADVVVGLTIKAWVEKD